MLSAAPKTTLWRGPGPSFEPGMGDVEAGTLTTRPPYLLKKFVFEYFRGRQQSDRRRQQSGAWVEQNLPPVQVRNVFFFIYNYNCYQCCGSGSRSKLDTQHLCGSGSGSLFRIQIQCIWIHNTDCHIFNAFSLLLYTFYNFTLFSHIFNGLSVLFLYFQSNLQYISSFFLWNFTGTVSFFDLLNSYLKKCSIRID